MKNKLVGVLGFDSKRPERFFREVLEILRDDQIRSPAYGCREYVAFVGIGEVQSGDRSS